MESVHKPLVLLLAFLIAFSSLTTPSYGHKANLGNHNAKNGDTGAKQEHQTEIPSMASMYFPASNGQKGDLDYSGYPPNFYGYPPIGYGYPFPFFPFPGGIFGFPRGIFGFPRGIFPFPPFRGVPGGYGGVPGGYGGVPGRYGGVPGGYGGSPGGYGGSPGGYGGSPGGYGGSPGSYGSGRPGNKPSGGYGSKAEMKGKEVNPHD